MTASSRVRPRPDRGTAWAGLAGLGLGLLALGPGIGPGYLLNYDMVFVPRPPLNGLALGTAGLPPRAVPSDLAVAVIARVLPADLVQKLVLLCIFVLACAGAAALLSAEHVLARLTAGVFYAWNPFVAERLLLGQWALLLGYAGLPWVARALTRPRDPPRRMAARLAVALIPAAIGGFAAMCICLPVVVAVTACTAANDWAQRCRRIAAGLGVLSIASLPWLIPALARPVDTSPAGVAAFAARADTPFGSAGSLLMLGGSWNSQAVPTGYGGASSVIWLAVVVAAVAGFALLGRGRWPGLGVAAWAGLAVASLGIASQGRAALRSMIGAWAGFAVLRDGQQFIAPLALAEAAGLGLTVAWLLRPASRGVPREIRVLAGLVALIMPVIAVPGLAWGATGRLKPVQYPADWLAARRVIDGAGPGTKVLLLPWAAYRQYPWNNGQPVLDPWPRLLDAAVIWNDTLRVGDQVVPSEDSAVRGLSPLLASARPVTRALLAAGVRFVIVDAGLGTGTAPGGGRGLLPFQSRLPGAHVVAAGPDLVVYRLGAAGSASGADATRSTQTETGDY